MGGEEAREMKRQERERELEAKACERERWMGWNNVGTANLI